MSREVVIPSDTVVETIQMYQVYKHDFTISVTINEMEVILDENEDPTENMKVNNNVATKHYIIDGDYYRALMSGHPTWSPTKPEEMFGQSDIWACIDAIRSGETMDIGVETDKSKNKY